MRKLFALLIAVGTLFVGSLPAIASADLTVTSPTSIEYDPTVSGFTVAGITISNAPAYLQVGLTVVDNAGNQVPATDPYRVAVGNQCSKDADWTNSDTGGVVTVSGDNTTNVILSGTAENITAILDYVWIYEDSSSFCGPSSGASFGQSLLNRKLQVSAIESSPGLMWSPSTHHYYRLATNTTDDGMGQPTDDNGNVTDPSRWFVSWSTARTEAKDPSNDIVIGGQTHRGYLASITTKDEFSFLNDNVTGGSGILYPAWVGGSDAGTEGVWKWVDGPEAAKFGGDTFSHYVRRIFAPDGSLLQQDSEGDYYLNYPTDGYDYFSYTSDILLMRDGAGDLVQDPGTGFEVAVDPANYCSNYYADPYAALNAMSSDGPQIVPSGYSSSVVCNVTWGGWSPVLTAQIEDGSGNYYDVTHNAIYKYGAYGYPATDDNHNNLAVVVGTNDFSDQSGTFDNYDGASFWGPDSGGPPNGSPNYCKDRGVRGICHVDQMDTSGTIESNSYYVYWSNGNAGYNNANWDGTGAKDGDGVYNPQPDNYTGNDPNGEDALIINWCARNAGVGNWSTATEESLYGNDGYYCTPGWNDLAAGHWSRSSTTYGGPDVDTPNQIGTTDFVIEYCGYADEGGDCIAPLSAASTTSFTLATTSCPDSGSSQLSVSYAGAGIDATDLTSPTMATESFNNVPTGDMSAQMTIVGYLTGSTHVYSADLFGGSGGSGNYASAADTMITLPTTECYVGFWWSAGNTTNYVDLLDSNNNVLASFNASDLVTALGNCPNPYCGNPNNGQDGGELFAYVHMRLPSGFQKVHFYGTGFELDNISTSVTIPGQSSNETNLGGSGAVTLNAPDVIPVDPQAASVILPELQVSGNAQATLCFRQVANAIGVPVDSSLIAFNPLGSDPITTQTIGSDQVISGATSDVISSSGHITVTRSDGTSLAPFESLYFRVSASATSSPDSSTCSSGTAKIIELRPIGLDFTDVFGIQVIEH